MDEYTIQPSPARAAYAPSHRLNAYKNFKYNRLIAWNAFAGTTHANSTSGITLWQLCGGTTLSGIVEPAKYVSNNLGIQFPGNYFVSGNQLKLHAHGYFTSLVDLTKLTFISTCSLPDGSESLGLFAQPVVTGDDEWGAWKMETTFSFFHGSSTDFSIRYVTGYGRLELMLQATGKSVIYNLVPQLSDPSGTWANGIVLYASMDFDTASANNSITGLGFEVTHFI